MKTMHSRKRKYSTVALNGKTYCMPGTFELWAYRTERSAHIAGYLPDDLYMRCEIVKKGAKYLVTKSGGYREPLDPNPFVSKNADGDYVLNVTDYFSAFFGVGRRWRNESKYGYKQASFRDKEAHRRYRIQVDDMVDRS